MRGGVMSFLVFSVISFLLSLGFTPLIIKICEKKNIYDDVDERKIHVGNIPRLGGIAIFTSFIIVTFICNAFNSSFEILDYWQVVVAFYIIFVTGLVDDFYNLPAKLKFVLQIVAAAFVALSPFYFHSFLGLQLPEIIGRGAIFAWILFCVNAYNMIDGMDLVCSGISFITISVFAICGYIENWGLYPVLFILIGSIAGFMFWNKPNAKIFLGDSGSTTLGLFIAVIPVLMPVKSPFQINNLFTCIYIAAIPTIDLIAAIIRRLRDKKGIFSADRAHLHHKLLNIGITKSKAIFCVLSVQFYISSVLLIPFLLHESYTSLLYFLAYVIVISLFIILHYINLQVNLYDNGVFDNCSYEYSQKRKESPIIKFIKIPNDGEECDTDYGNLVYQVIKRFAFIFLLVLSWLIAAKSDFTDFPNAQNIATFYSICFYTLLGMSLTMWFPRNVWKKQFVKSLIICLFVLLLCIIVDEVHQYFIPNRYGEVIDVLLGFIGATIGVVFGGLIQKLSKVPEVK